MEYNCDLCPRSCRAPRDDEKPGGFCRSPLLPNIVRAAPHDGEEPCISGMRGAGTIFFTGCSLRCIYCQNREINRGSVGKTVSVSRLRELMLRLQDQGVHCIDLVTPSHFAPAVVEALAGIQLEIPVVWNSSGYEKPETLRLLDGLVQVYLPDLKYLNAETARRYSAAADYPDAAQAAIREMVRQRGPCLFDDEGMLQSGVLIRHLILPGHVPESMDVIDWVAETFPEKSVLFSLMSQYTPMPATEAYPELQQRITKEENDNLVHYMRMRHLEGYWQEPDAAGEESIPLFDGTGLDF